MNRFSFAIQGVVLGVGIGFFLDLVGTYAKIYNDFIFVYVFPLTIFLFGVFYYDEIKKDWDDDNKKEGVVIRNTKRGQSNSRANKKHGSRKQYRKARKR